MPSTTETDVSTFLDVAVVMEELTAVSSSTTTSSVRLSSTNSTSSSSSVKMMKKKKCKNGVHKKKAIPPPEQPRKKSLIRKRPVTFGNPALGTYHGCVYTLDELGQDYAHTNTRPIIEGAESVERVVAMVDVPPEEVPEGVLNLSRSHRPYLYHVRILIAESREEFSMQDESHDRSSATSRNGIINDTDNIINNTNFDGGSGEQEAKEGFDYPNNPTADDNLQLRMGGGQEETKEEPPSSPPSSFSTATTQNQYQKKEETNSNNKRNVTSRTYIVLLELCSIDAAEAFVEDLHGKPYTSLDPSQKCSVHQVLALSGEDGVSLLSPFFAPTAKTTTTTNKSKNTTHQKKETAIANSNGTTTAASGKINNSSPTTTTTTKAAVIPVAAAQTPIVEDYNCAVCLEHMHLTETEKTEDTETDGASASMDPSSILTTVCNHTFHLDCLLQWQDSPCPVCRYDHSGLNEALSQCHVCGRTEHNYVCLICGIVSCGGPPLRVPSSPSNHMSESESSYAFSGGDITSASRMTSHSPVCGMPATSLYANDSNRSNSNNHRDLPLPPPPASENSINLLQSHARKHYDETLHAYALDTETQHVWDFAGQGYVHRLLQNKEDGKLVEFHDPSNTTSHERSTNPGLSDVQEGEVVHRKLEGFASQYYTLLKSQLEQQRTYYQGRLQELRRESLVRKQAQTSDWIMALRQEKAQLSRRLASLKARHDKVVSDISFIKNMNESLEANKEPLKLKVKDAQRRRSEAKDQIQQCIPVLEEKVTNLMLQLTGETLNTTDVENAHAEEAAFVESSTTNPTTPNHSDSSASDDQKPLAKR